MLENILEKKNILSCAVYKIGKEINFNKFIWVRIEENDFSKVLQCKTEEN